MRRWHIDGKSESSHRSQFLVGFMANQRGRGASPSLIGPPHCFSTVRPLAGFMNVQRAPMMLRSVRSRRRGLSQVTPRDPLFLVCSICRCSSCDGYNDDYDDDDGDDDDDQDEKNQNWFFFASRLRRYLLPSLYLPSSTRSLCARGGLLIHRKVGQPGTADEDELWCWGSTLDSLLARCSHPSFRRLLHALSSFLVLLANSIS